MRSEPTITITMQDGMQIELTSSADIEPLEVAAKLDQHVVLLPTHTCRKGGEIVGYLSIAATPVVMLWLHTQKVSRFDSFNALTFFENETKRFEHGIIMLPVPNKSPLKPYLKKLGYYELEDHTTFFKTQS